MIKPLYNREDRFRPYEELQKDSRPRFWRDYQRIVSCPAFRRLAGKTQLFPGKESDFFRTRLSHSIEVAHIGKSIGQLINRQLLKIYEKTENDISLEKVKSVLLDLDLIQSACLAHDIGHPPFGHQGEAALNEEMIEYGGFEGNAQTLRILTKLEKKVYAKEANDTGFDDNNLDKRFGINLTYRTLASVLKYDHLIDYSALKLTDSKKISLQKGYYKEEEELVNDIKKSVIGSLSINSKFKTIECQIMDLADDIAYSTYDFEDALKGGFVSLFDYLNTDNVIWNKIASSLLSDVDEEDENFKNHFIEIFKTSFVLKKIKSDKQILEIQIEQLKKILNINGSDLLTKELPDFVQYLYNKEKFESYILLLNSIENEGLKLTDLKLKNSTEVLIPLIEEFLKELLFKMVIEEFKEELKLWPKNQTKRSKLENIAKLISKDQKFGKDGFKRSLLTSQIIKKSINRIKIQVNNDLPPCLWKVDYEKKEARFLVYLLKKLNYYIQIDSNKLKIIEDRGKEIVKNIFNKIIDLKGKILPSDYRIKFELFLNEAQYFIELAEKYRTNEEEYMNYYNQAKQCQYRIVCDFIASMTDDYAVRFYNRLHSDHPDTIYRNVD